MFRGFFDVLRPGGVLGVVEHRAKGDVADDDKSGYVGEQQVIAMAEAAGFTLDAKSEKSEEHTSELQSLMRISYAVFCLKKTNNKTIIDSQDRYMNQHRTH